MRANCAKLLIFRASVEVPRNWLFSGSLPLEANELRSEAIEAWGRNVFAAEHDSEDTGSDTDDVGEVSFCCNFNSP